MMIKRIFRSQTKTITFAALILGVSALLSRLLGLVRDRLLAGTFGASENLDVYFAAFRIPDFVYGILIMGGISAIFLPVFSEYFKKNEEDGWRLASNILNCFLVLLILICGVLAILTPWLIKFITPGFSPEQKDLAVNLTRIMFLSPIFLGLSSLFSGVLHYFNRFLAYSLAPIAYNLSIILGILVFVPIFGLWGLAYGVVLGAVLHWLVQIPAAKISGFRYLPIFDFKSPGLKKIFKLMIPRIVGASVYHINLIVITAIGSTLIAGSISIFNFANNIQYFPIGIIGASFALASFPVLSRAWADGRKQEFLDNFSLVFRQILFSIIPISVLMFLLRVQIVRLVLGVGQFGWLETRLTAASLGLFCFGIVAFAFTPFLLRSFFSLQDTKTPTVIGLIYMIFNTALCLLLVWLLSFPNIFREFMASSLKLQGIQDISVIGLPFAVSVSGIFYFFLLLIFLKRKIGDIRLKEIMGSFWKVILASSLMGLAVYFSLQLAAQFVNMQSFVGLFIQVVTACFVGAVFYIALTLFLKAAEIKTLLKSFNDR